MTYSTTYTGIFGLTFLTMAIGFGGTATVWADEPTKPSEGSDQGVRSVQYRG